MAFLYTNDTGELIKDPEGKLMSGVTAEDCCCAETFTSYIAENCIDGTFTTVNGDNLQPGDIVKTDPDCWFIVGPTTYVPAAPVVTAIPDATCKTCTELETCQDLILWLASNATSLVISCPPMSNYACDDCPAIPSETDPIPITPANYVPGPPIQFFNANWSISNPEHPSGCPNLEDLYDPSPYTESTQISLTITCVDDNIVFRINQEHNWTPGFFDRSQTCIFIRTIPWEDFALTDLTYMQVPFSVQGNHDTPAFPGGPTTRTCNCGTAPAEITFIY